MEIYQLKVFLEVARYLSFTEAADVLNLTQPAVSAKIKSLEESLDIPLFQRLGRKIKLTKAGEYLFDNGPDLIALEHRITQEIHEIKGGKFSRLKIGCTTNVAENWIPPILFQSRQAYPHVELVCHSFSSPNSLHQAIAEGDVQIGFSEISFDGFHEIESKPIDRFQYCLTVANDHNLASHKWASLKDLSTEPWVFPAPGTPESLALKARLFELGMTISDFSNHEVVHTQSLMSTFLRQGHYLGFSSSFQFQSERQAKLLVSIPLQEFSLESRLFLLIPKKTSKVTHNISKRKGSNFVSIEQKFIKLVEQYTSQTLSFRNLSINTSISAQAPSSHIKKNVLEEEVKHDHRKSIGEILTEKYPSLHFYSPSFPSEKPNHSKSNTFELKIGTQNKTIQTVTAGLIIKELGLLEHFLPRDGRYKNIKYCIKWCDFTSGAPIVQGLEKNQLDIGILGDYPLLLSALKHSNTSKSVTGTRLVSFVASNPDGSGNTIIVPSSSPLKSLSDLRDRSIAVPFSSAAHGMIMRTLTRSNLLQDVTLTSIHRLNINQLTPRKSQADGYAYFAPLYEIANSHGHFRRLIDSAEIATLPTFHGVVVQANLAEHHPDIIVAYLKALLAAQNWYISNSNTLSLVSQWARLDPEIVAKTLEYSRIKTEGLFLPETTIRSDWITEHIQELKLIPGNQQLEDIQLSSWIQPEFLETAISSI